MAVASTPVPTPTTHRMTIRPGPYSPYEASPPIPTFEPHPWFRGGHLQTIAARSLPGPRVRLPAERHVIEADDGDRLSVLESIAPGWTAGRPVAVLVHGLAGDARAPYVVRVASRLFRLG